MHSRTHDGGTLARALLVAVHRVDHDGSGVCCEVDVDLQPADDDPLIVRRRLRLPSPPTALRVGAELVVWVPPDPDAVLIAQP